jgi:DNA invertase Pin-like site-specific DNA recombinase
MHTNADHFQARSASAQCRVPAVGGGKRAGGVVFCDLPQVPPGPSGKFVIAIMAAVAELEAGLISERPKAALAQAKARGVRLGNPRLHSGTREQALQAAAASGAKRMNMRRVCFPTSRQHGRLAAPRWRN